MKSALARIADGSAASEGPAADAAEPRSPYLADLYGVIDEIEALFPEVVRILRERIADLERFLVRSENPFIQHDAIAATREIVQAVHRVIKKIAGTHQSEAPES